MGGRVTSKELGSIWLRAVVGEHVMTGFDPVKKLSLSGPKVSDGGLIHLNDLFIHRGPPEYIRSDNGPEFTAHRVRDWLENVGVKTLFIEPGSPWENGVIESFNGKLRDELLNTELFGTLLETRALIER